MKFLFRVDASLSIGTGHVMRCLALARKLKKNNCEIEFISRKHEGNLVKKIREKIKNKEVFYDHLADKSSSNRWNDNYKLKKIENSYLPKYLQLNSNQFKNWFD